MTAADASRTLKTIGLNMVEALFYCIILLHGGTSLGVMHGMNKALAACLLLGVTALLLAQQPRQTPGTAPGRIATGGATQATYVYGNYVDEILTMGRGGQTYYYHRNALWSVEAVTVGSASAVERYAYDAYGSVAVSDGSFTPVAPNAWATPHSAIGNPWSFTGRQLDEEAGLYFYRARYYDAAEGRFLQVDPKWNFFDRQGDFRARSDPRARSRANLTAKSTDLAIPAADDDQYEYARDNPLRYTDPSGESYCVCTKPMPALPACTAVTPPGTVKNFSCAGTCQGLFGTGCPCTKLCTTTCKVKTTTVNAGVISFSTTSYAWEGGWDVPFNPTWHCEDDCGAILY